MNEVKNKKSPWRVIAGAAIALSAAAIIGQSVLASLNATAFNTVAENVSAGTLKLKLTDNGAGFTQSVSNLAPGDIVNRYVTLKNDGTLEGRDLKLSTTQTGDTELITDGVSPSTTKGLRLAVYSCSGTWTTSTGVCVGTTTTEIASTPLNSFSSAIAMLPGSFASSAEKQLKISLQLPDQNETTVNGLLPANTVQGKAIAITYTFDFAQRVASETNS